MFKKKFDNKIYLLFFLFAAALFTAVSFFEISTSQQFSELANSFLHGKTYFLDGSYFNNRLRDNTPFMGHYYWPLGPFPAVVLMPFVGLFGFFGFYFFQSYLNYFLVLGIAYLVFLLARKIKYSDLDAFFLSVAFVFGSVFFGVAPHSSSWYFAQTITVFLLFLAIWEYFGKKRHWLIGLFLGMVLLTRVTAAVAILFFALDILLKKSLSQKVKIEKLAKLFVIPAICFLLLSTYNYVRFGDPLDQGYRAQILFEQFDVDKEEYGLFNIQYLPRGIYYSLLAMPNPNINSDTHNLAFPFVVADPWGMSIFVNSPFLLYLFFLKIKKKRAKLLIITSYVIWFGIAASVFIGHKQFGFRYALDFMPLLFTAFMITYRDNFSKLSRNLKLLIIFSGLTNVYLLYTLFKL